MYTYTDINQYTQTLTNTIFINTCDKSQKDIPCTQQYAALHLHSSQPKLCKTVTEQLPQLVTVSIVWSQSLATMVSRVTAGIVPHCLWPGYVIPQATIQKQEDY